MKYFLDQEFIEGFHKPWFGKRRHFIDLISIGIVAEDGREYYAINSEYDYFKADDWVIQNVIRPIYAQEVTDAVRSKYEFCTFEQTEFLHVSNFHRYVGKPVKQIAKEIIEFMNPCIGVYMTQEGMAEYRKVHNVKDFTDPAIDFPLVRDEWAQPELYGYFSDYDWVLFCSLFGRMIELPKGFPMYCRDLKQTLDERAERNAKLFGGTVNDALAEIKRHVAYPKGQNEHNALADARFNRDLYNFLQKL